VKRNPFDRLADALTVRADRFLRDAEGSPSLKPFGDFLARASSLLILVGVLQMVIWYRGPVAWLLIEVMKR
jgi:hypothetical protein